MATGPAASVHAMAGARWAPGVQSIRNWLLCKLRSRCRNVASTELCAPPARPLRTPGYNPALLLTPADNNCLSLHPKSGCWGFARFPCMNHAL